MNLATMEAKTSDMLTHAQPTSRQTSASMLRPYPPGQGRSMEADIPRQEGDDDDEHEHKHEDEDHHDSDDRATTRGRRRPTKDDDHEHDTRFSVAGLELKRPPTPKGP